MFVLISPGIHFRAGCQPGKNVLKAFANQHGHRIAGWYIDNVSGTTMNRPELIRLLGDAEHGDVILIEQVDRLTRPMMQAGRHSESKLQTSSWPSSVLIYRPAIWRYPAQ